MSKLPPHLANRSNSELERMCVRCGMCCFASARLDKNCEGSIFIPDLCCKYLHFNKNISECEVYKNRHQVAKWCMPLEKAIEKGVFPPQCPYVKDMPGYVGANVLSNEEYDLLKSYLVETFKSQGQPVWVKDHNWQRFIKADP